MTTKSSSDLWGRRISLMILKGILPLIVSLAVGRANNKIADSGLPSWTAMFAAAVLSLLILSALCRGHGGFNRNRVASRLGKGSTFTPSLLLAA